MIRRIVVDCCVIRACGERNNTNNVPVVGLPSMHCNTFVIIAVSKTRPNSLPRFVLFFLNN